MGGKALKIGTIRLQRKEFETLVLELKPQLEAIFLKVEMPKFFETKESFGDADFVVLSDGITFNVKDKIQEIFNPNEIFHNSNVYSFDYKKFQIDVILASSKYYDTILTYMGYNDVGNLIGSVAKAKFNLKYGQKGLCHQFYYNGKNLGEIEISKDYLKIIPFLGFNYNKFQEGFKTLDEIFEFVINSKYFNPYYYQVENLNRINRHRNSKREVYNRFLVKIEGLKNNYPKYDLTMKISGGEYYDLIESTFPEANFKEQMQTLIAMELRRIEIAEKFNGKIIMDLYPELVGSELGEIIKKFKAKQINFNDYILNTDKETILNDFKKLYNVNYI